MNSQRGSLIITLAPLMLALAGALIALHTLNYNSHEMLSVISHEARLDNKRKNSLLLRAFKTENLTTCISQDGWSVCPLPSANQLHDFDPIFSETSSCATMTKKPPLLLDNDDIASVFNCTNPPLTRNAEIFHSNLSITQSTTISQTRLIAVLGQTSIRGNLKVSSDTTLFSAGSVIIDSVMIDPGKQLEIIGCRSIHVNRKNGSGELKITLLKESGTKALPFLPKLSNYLWSLRIDRQD